jgi:hypothetical protein
VETLHLALQNMQAALQMLDSLRAPADIGAHLDLAISRLTEFLNEGGNHSSGPLPEDGQ